MSTIKHFTVVNLFILFVFTVQLLILPDLECFAEEIQSQNDTQEIRLVIVPEKNIFEQRRRYKYLTDYLSSKMNMKISVEIMANYGDISNAFVDGTADAGFFGSFSYILTHAGTGVEPITRPVWTDNSSTYRGFIFARKDSNISTVKDMKNKRLVLVDRATTAGYIFPLFYFKYYGIPNIEDYFSTISFARSHDAAIWAVYSGEADIGGAKNTIYNRFVEENPDFREQMMVLAESPEVPSNGLAVRKDLNPAIKLLLKTLLLTMYENPEGREALENFGAKKFIETSDDDYIPLYNMTQRNPFLILSILLALH